MSNVEEGPHLQVCEPAAEDHARTDVLVLQPREVLLGGPRAMTVRRTLPHRDRSLVGAWCFVDHFGPDEVSASGGMDVPPHPHTGLQTVSWLFTGEIEHRDAAGNHAVVRPGELNLMTAGHGIAHSEVSTPDTTALHGVQLWVVLPRQAAGGDPGFVHHAPVPAMIGEATVRVFLGSLAGVSSAVPTATPLLGAEVLLPANRRSTEEIRVQRAEWMAHSDRFGTVPGYEPATAGGATWLPAPELPALTLRPRRR